MRARMTAPATIHVFTYKDGLLARLAHDLRLSLRRFELRRAGDAVSGRFWPASLSVDGVAGRDGRVDAAALSESDRAKIVRNATEEILHTERDPEVRFEGALVDGGRAVDGALTMVGRTCPVRAEVRAEGGRLRAEVVLAPSRWGIAPYKALAGAIKLQDRVLVRLDLPADPAGGATTPDPCAWSAG